MRVLVTRPRDQAEATAELLRRRGHEPLVDPILQIEPVPLPPIEPAGFAALVVTSANAVPVLLDSLRGMALYTVGGATSAAVRAAGWPVAGEAAGDGAALARLLMAELRPGRLLHLGGEDRAAGLEQALAGSGLTIEHRVAYRAVAATSLPSATREGLLSGGLDVVLLLSPRTASVWCSLVREAGLEREVSGLIAACLSEAVAEKARALPWRKIRVARLRDQSALVDSLDEPQMKVIAETSAAPET